MAFAPKLKRLGSETLIYGLSTIVGRLLVYILQPYYAHEFPPDQAGISGVVFAYMSIVGIGLYLGMDIAYMRNAASKKNASQEERQRAYTMALAMVAAIGGAVVAIGLMAAPWAAPRARLDPVAFRYMIAIMYTDALIAVPWAHLRMTGQATRYGTLKILFAFVSIALNIFLISYRHWDVTAIFAANVVANLTVLVCFLGDISRMFRPALLGSAAWRPLWAYALPVIPAAIAVNLVENADLITLTYLPAPVARLVYHAESAKAVVGIYNFNYKLGIAMALVVGMFRLAWTPFSLQHARERRAPELYSRVLTALMLVCASVFLVISLLLPVLAQVPVVHAYVKPEYWQALPIVPVILVGYIFSGMYSVVTAGLYIERHTRSLAWIAGAGALTNVAICIVAAPRWGLVSVACATPAAYMLMAALGAWQSNRVYPVPFEWGRLAVLGALAAALFAVDLAAASHGIAPVSAAGLASKTALLLAFPVLLVGFGFFRHGEISALRSILSRS